MDDAVADRDMDQQVAPVPATGHQAVRGLAPAVQAQDRQNDQGDRGRDRSRPVRRPAAPDRCSAGRHSSGGNVTGVSDGSRIRAMTTVAIASSAAATRTAARPKPSSSATNLTVCADRYTLVTTATPAAPGRGRSGATRRTMTQPGTANSHGQTATTPRAGTNHDSRNEPVSPRRMTVTVVVGRGSTPNRSSAGGCTEGG